jgi:cell division protein FtsW
VQWDFIYSVIAEELGFIGTMFLLTLYMYIAYRGFYIYTRVTDIFAKFAAAWISSWFIVQAFINIGVNLNIVPLTGITLPFVSYGGSSLMTLMLALAVLLNISRDVHLKPKFKRLWKRNMIK